MCEDEINYINIDADQAIKVRIYTIYGNSLTLDFKFYDSLGVAYDVSGVQFVFTVTDVLLQKEKYKIINTQWTRPFANEIKKVINPFPLAQETYKIDFTATFTDGVIQTLMDGELIIRERLIHV
jgi:hypothetical protein